MWYFCPLYEFVIVEVAQFYSCSEQSLERLVNGIHCQISIFQGLGDILIYRTTFYVGAGNDCRTGSNCRGFRHSMAVLPMEITNGTTVAHHESFVSPFIPENAL